MRFSRNNIFIILTFFFGCSSSNYKVIVNKDLGAKVIASPDRFLAYCEKVIKDDNSVAYGFMVMFLDEKNTVGGAVGMLTTHKMCLKWRSGAQNILNAGKLITLSGFGGLEEPRVTREHSYTFGELGTFHSNGRSLAFFSISNNAGHCFSLDPDRCKI
jgi:hypothetical protein